MTIPEIDSTRSEPILDYSCSSKDHSRNAASRGSITVHDFFLWRRHLSRPLPYRELVVPAHWKLYSHHPVPRHRRKRRQLYRSTTQTH